MTKEQKKVLPLIGVAALLVVGSLSVRAYRNVPDDSPLEASPYSTWTVQEGAALGKKLDDQEARRLVEIRHETQHWLAEFPNDLSPATGGHPIIEVDSSTDAKVTIHAYESMENRIVTYGWYDVSRETGQIVSILPEEPIDQTHCHVPIGEENTSDECHSHD
jgi:hypothetical protein